MEEKPNYYSIIPAEVRYDKSLKDKAKLLYSEITALTQKEGKCWASNNYFANLYGVSVQTISSLMKELEEKGYISRDVIYKEGSKEILYRVIKISCRGYTKNLVGGIQENFKDNNTSINNTSINKKEIYKEKEIKHHIGEYNNVLLTDKELEKLNDTYGENKTNELITFLDEYIEMKGYKAKSHYLAIKKWVVDAVFKENQKAGGLPF